MLVLVSSAGAAAQAGTPGSGVLYFTTYQNQGYCTSNCTPNVFTVNWSYDGNTTFTLSPSVANSVYNNKFGSVLATLKGADGILFTPTGSNLLVAGQESNQIFDLNPQTGAVVNSAAVNKNAYHMVVDPSGASVWTFGQQGDYPGPPSNVPLPIGSGGGTVYSVTTASGGSYGLTQMAFVPVADVGLTLNPSPLVYEGNYVIFYTSSPDQGGGDFGYLTQGSSANSFVAIPLLQNQTWTHGLLYDAFSGDLIATGGNEIAQIDVSSSSMNVVTYSVASGTQFDQAKTDGAGHLFVADNKGNLYFMDYSLGRSVAHPGFVTNVFLATNLDDVVNQLPEVPLAIALPGVLLAAGFVTARRRQRIARHLYQR